MTIHYDIPVMDLNLFSSQEGKDRLLKILSENEYSLRNSDIPVIFEQIISPNFNDRFFPDSELPINLITGVCKFNKPVERDILFGEVQTLSTPLGQILDQAIYSNNYRCFLVANVINTMIRYKENCDLVKTDIEVYGVYICLNSEFGFIQS